MEGVAEADPVRIVPLADALFVPVPVICVTLAVMELAALPDVALPLLLALALALPLELALPVSVACALPSFSAPLVTVTDRVRISSPW